MGVLEEVKQKRKECTGGLVVCERFQVEIRAVIIWPYNVNVSWWFWS